MSLVRTMNALVDRTVCETCERTWSQSGTQMCKDCKFRLSGKVHMYPMVECEGCLYLIRTSTKNADGLCGKCANIYDPLTRSGYCSEGKLDDHLSGAGWVEEEVDRVCPNSGEYFIEKKNLGILVEDPLIEDEYEEDSEYEESDEESSSSEDDEVESSSDSESESSDDYEGESSDSDDAISPPTSDESEDDESEDYESDSRPEKREIEDAELPDSKRLRVI